MPMEIGIFQVSSCGSAHQQTQQERALQNLLQQQKSFIRPSRVNEQRSRRMAKPPRTNLPQPLNSRNVMLNARALSFTRTSLSVLAGMTAGILGLTSVMGIAFYFVVSIILSIVYLVKESRSEALHFLHKQQLLTGFVAENLFTYILMWTLVYGCVHVY